VAKTQSEIPTLRLARLIEAGMRQVTEVRIVPFILKDKDKGFMACALGMALISKIGDAKEAESMWWHASNSLGMVPESFMAKQLEMPLILVAEVNAAHCCCGIPAATIIEKLRAGDFDKYV